MEDFVYAFIQLVHNAGAAAVVGSPAAGWWLSSSNPPDGTITNRFLWTQAILKKLAWLTIFAWSLQIASGASFGATTYYLKHELPDLTGVGFAALLIKVSCAFICLILALIYLVKSSNWSVNGQKRTWQTLFTLGFIALISAAFLRWYG